MKRTNARGSALAAVLVVTILLAGLAAALATYSFPFIRSSEAFNESLYALYGAEGALETAKLMVAASTYTDVGNQWLMANSNATGKKIWNQNAWIGTQAGGTTAGDLSVGDSRISVTIFDLGNDFYRVEATATHGTMQVKLVQDLRSRDTFARYMFFVDVDDLNVGSTTVRGSVYTGKHLNNYFGGAKYYKDVAARMGVGYFSGATAQNTSYFDTTDWNSPNIPMPATNEIATLHGDASGVYNVTDENGSPYQGAGAMNTEIEFLGDQVKITARKKSTGAIVKTGTYPQPANGLIFVQGDVTSLKGKSSGRTTVATMGRVSITDRLTYVDSAGNPEYLLYKDGVPVPGNNTPPGVVWDSQYTYTKNPAFSADPANPPVVGIMAASDVEIVTSAPYNMEMHAAVFSSTKRWSCNLATKKGNLKVLGSIVNKLGGWRYNGAGYGYAKSGEYIYDQTLLQNPPPHFLAVDKPIFGPRRQEN